MVKYQPEDPTVTVVWKYGLQVNLYKCIFMDLWGKWSMLGHTIWQFSPDTFWELDLWRLHGWSSSFRHSWEAGLLCSGSDRQNVVQRLTGSSTFLFLTGRAELVWSAGFFHSERNWCAVCQPFPPWHIPGEAQPFWGSFERQTDKRRRVND